MGVYDENRRSYRDQDLRGGLSPSHFDDEGRCFFCFQPIERIAKNSQSLVTDSVEACRQCIVEQQASDQRLPDSDNELDDLKCLQCADDPG